MRIRVRRRSAAADPGLDELDAPEAAAEHYRSVDSAPVEYSLNRPPSVVNGFLVSFVAVSLLVLLAMTVVVELGYPDESRDIVLLSAPGARAAVPVRLFVLVFFLVLGLSLATNAWRRALVLLELCGGLLLVGLVLDLAALASDRLAGVPVPVAVQQTGSAVVGLALLPVVVLRQAHLPDPVAVPAEPGRIRPGAWIRLLVALALATALAVVAARRFDPVVSAMRELSLLGGVGPGVFLVQQALMLITGAVGVLLVARSRRGEFAPPLAVLVPAHNEAHGIAGTVAALDRAARAYAGSVRLYVVDNASTDQTVSVTRRAIERSSHLTGSLLSCPEPGKARALNHGLARITEPFVVRVDADARLAEDCLGLVMRHFSTAQVGAVGGLPLPPEERTFVDRVRLVEVLVRHGFFQVSRVAYDGVVGVPGMFTAFRRAALDEAGPLQQGINGEDTDICLRLTSLGYRCLVDPRARYTSEVPRTWAHLREQRTRWFRSTFHVAAHNRRLLLRPVSMAGAVVLPFALWNAARRAALLPVLLWAVLVLVLYSPTFAGLRWQPVLAMVIGLPALVAVAVCLLLGRPRAVLYVPEYLLFRLVRSYFTLAALLSLRFPPLEPPWHRGRPARGPGRHQGPGRDPETEGQDADGAATDRSPAGESGSRTPHGPP